MSENDQSGEITAKQALFVAAYLTPGLSIAASAKLVKIADKTARRWLKLPVVVAAIRQAQADMYQEAMQAVLHLMDKSIKTLERNLEGEEVPASVQVSAARIVLELAGNVHHDAELERRIAGLEKSLLEGLEQ